MHPSASKHPWYVSDFDESWSVGLLLRQSVDQFPERDAFLSQDGKWLTRQRLWQFAARVRCQFLGAGAAPSGVVACMNHVGVPWVVAVMAVLTSNRTLVALDPGAPDAVNEAALSESGAETILVDKEFSAIAVRLAGRSRRVIVIDEAIEEQYAEIDEEAPVLVDFPGAIVFTSGSTGRPKGVIRSQKSLAHMVYSFGKVYRDAPDDTVLYFGTPTHVASLNVLLRCLISGSRMIAVQFSDVDLKRVCALASQNRVNVVVCGTALLRLMLHEISARDFPDMRYALTSGAPLGLADVAQWDSVFPGVPIMQNYGSTETGPMAAGRYYGSVADVDGALPLQLVHEGCRIDVVDDAGDPVPAGVKGRIRIHSKYLADGYVSGRGPSEDGTPTPFGLDDAGPYFLSNDIGLRNESGELFVLARRGRELKINGRRIDLAEVERQISADDHWAAAVAVTATVGGSAQLVALVIPATASKPDLLALRRSLEGRLNPSAIPHRFVIVDEFPTTASGKIDYPMCETIAARDGAVAKLGMGGPPLGFAECWMADALQQVLGIGRPGRLDRFTDLGGDSRSAIEFLHALERQFGVTLSIDRLTASPTIASLATELEFGACARTPVVSLRADGDGPVWLLIPGIGGHAWVFSSLAAAMRSPCDALSLSLVDIAKCPARELRNRIRSEALTALEGLPKQGRPIMVAGFSFGALIASDFVCWLQGQSVPVNGLYLLDPSPLTSASSLLNSWRLELRATRRKLREQRTLVRSQAAKRLEDEVRVTSRRIRKAYLDGSVRLPDVPLHVAVSTEFSDKYSHRAILLGRPIRRFKNTVFPTDHLGMLRNPHVIRLAEWLEELS